jgi:pimeloyl-ACP methyl ester carboxylesterase
MTKKVLAIHGAFSTPVIFNYLVDKCGPYKITCVDYSEHAHTIQEAVDHLRWVISKQTSPFHLVGHSMGGLLALALKDLSGVESISTIATPLCGLEYNFLLYWLNTSALVSDLYHFHPFVRNLHNQTYDLPIQHLISTRGHNPLIWQPNDGVVTLASQNNWHVGAQHLIASNHAEIMINPQTARILKQFWNNLSLTQQKKHVDCVGIKENSNVDQQD